MKFHQNSHELFRKWYVDVRIYFHKIVDSKRPQQGMVDIRNVDPLKIKKVRNVEKEKDTKEKSDVNIETSTDKARAKIGKTYAEPLKTKRKDFNKKNETNQTKNVYTLPDGIKNNPKINSH